MAATVNPHTAVDLSPDRSLSRLKLVETESLFGIV